MSALVSIVILLCREENLARIPGPHGFSFLKGNRDFMDLLNAKATSYDLTNFFVDHVENLVIADLWLMCCAETLFFDYHRQLGLRIKVGRIVNTYGPRMHPNDGRVVSNFIVQALKGQSITIFGDGSQTRSFCYVDDLIEAFVGMMASADEVIGPINLGNPGEFSILELAEKVLALTGSKSELVFQSLPQDDPKQRCPDIARAQALLGWAPTVPLEQGREKTIAYFDALLRADLV